MADDLNKPSFYPRVGNIRPQPRSPLQQAEMRERPLDAAMGALKRVLDKGSELLDKNPATPFDVTRGMISAIPFAGPRLANQFEQSNISIPVGMSLDSRNAGIETVDVPTKDALNAIKWSDLVGTQGASRAAESIGYGEAPDFFDALDATAVGLGGLQAAKIAARVPRAAKFAVTQAAKDFAEASAAGAPHVVKPKGGNFLGGNMSGAAVGNVDKSLGRYKTPTIAGDTPADRIPKHEALLEDPSLNQDQLDRVRYQLEQTKGEAAVDNWIQNNIGNYIKKDMATPTDPVRLMLDRRTQEIEAQFQIDMARAERTRARAEAEPDPRRQANLQRQAAQQEEQAKIDRDFSTEYITHLPKEEDRGLRLNSDDEILNQVKDKRQQAGFPVEGMAKSDAAKQWEAISDEAVGVTRAGDVQAQRDAMTKAQEAERAFINKDDEIHDKFPSRLREISAERGSPLTDKDIDALVQNLPTSQKAAIIGEYDDWTALRNQSQQARADVNSGLWSAYNENQWVDKLDPETKLYSAYINDLGLDHVIDVIRQDVAAGRIRPEQLNKLSMDQAVQRTAEFNMEQAKKMRETAIRQQEGFPTYKDYGDEGYKWIELAKPENPTELPPTHKLEQYDSKVHGGTGYRVVNTETGMKGEGFQTPERALDNFYNSHAEERLAEALKYEGDTMGHCVGGYCPDVLEGRSRIYSLRDKRGEPHVTVEVKPISDSELIKTIDWKKYQELQDQDPNLASQWMAEQKAKAPQSIRQIKGKQNAKPKEDYIPYVQDFVRSGEWSDVGDFQNTGLIDMSKSAIPWSKSIQPEQIDQLVGGMEGGTQTPRYGVDEFKDRALNQIGKRYVTQQEFDDFLLKELMPPEEGMAAGGTPRYPTEQEREAMRKLRESFLPAAKEAERLKRLYDNMEKSNKKVSFSDNPDTMMMELGDVKMANVKAANDDEVHMSAAGAVADAVKLAKAKKAAKAEELTKLERAPAKTKAEIDAIAQRMAPQMTGEYVRASDKSAKTVAGKTQKQFEREKTLEHDIRPTGDERPLPETVDIESLKGNIMMGIAGDPTITGQTVYSVAGEPLRSPAPQHGGPLYGLGKDDKFWASQLGAAQGVQNRAGALSELYQAPVVGNYVKMGPDSYSYAQHFADTNLQNIPIERMTKAQIEGFNKLVREGSPKSGPRPSWAGIENPDLAYLQMAVDPELRKHFGNLMQMPTVTETFGLRSGQDVAHAVTEPDLRNLEIGVTGKSLGMMRPEVTDLKLSEHPTYSHDIPGQFIGGLKYPTPYELMFPDSIKAVRENPAQAPQEFGSFKMSGPRQIIDPQMIDEIKQYEEFIKKYTGKAEGGAITVKPKKMAEGGEITAEDLEIEERPL